MYTNTFQGDTGNQVLLLEKAGRRRDERYLPAFQSLGNTSASILMPAKLETWLLDSDFSSMQINPFQRKTGREVILPAFSFLSLGGWLGEYMLAP